MGTEEYLKKHLCQNCHIGILWEHQEEKFRILQYFKCYLCGFTKQIKKKKDGK